MLVVISQKQGAESLRGLRKKQLAVLSLPLGHQPNRVLVRGAFFQLRVELEADLQSEVELAA
jgi:hypothetical protein